MLEFCETLRKKFAEHREEAKQKKKEQAMQVVDEERPPAEYANESGTDEEDMVINDVITNVEMGEVEARGARSVDLGRWKRVSGYGGPP